MILPTDATARKRIPLFTGVLAYFPRALCQVAKVSLKGNEQHHPGKPLHWDKSKSTDQLDALTRHLVDSLDPAHDRIETLAQVAWRALAELETACENAVPKTGTNLPTFDKSIARAHDAMAGGYEWEAAP